MTETAETSILVAAPQHAVWRALTEPAAIAEYLFGTQVTTDWKKGSPIVYRGEWEGKPYEDKGTILEIDPPRLLATSYYSPLSGKPDAPESYQNVTYTVEPEGSGTRVTVRQDGCADRAEADRMVENWGMTLAGMKGVVERGV
ncbi:SRPBCC family protein [Leifsonia sp. NPDC058230]|uniref:SRPBCC family protein n=1 Tax=Leifsonia sp. NPDC058230 TaxID=3346391 RepID=UPI0036DA4290